MNIINPATPKGEGWQKMDVEHPNRDSRYPSELWIYKNRLAVISAIEVASDPNDIDRGPEYHISISAHGQTRCTRNEARFVLKAFGIDGMEEDNHVPGGFVRNYWRPVAENLVGIECPCKEHEPAIIEDKGDFTWRGITE